MAGAALESLAGAVPRLTRLCDYVEYYAHRGPEREAVVWRDVRLSYAQVNAAIAGYAAGLAAFGIGRNDRVAMLTTPRPEFYIVLMACQRVGAVWVGLNARYRFPEIEHVLLDCMPKLLVSLSSGPDGRDYTADLEGLSQATGAPILTFPRPLDGLGAALDSLAGTREPGPALSPAASPDDPAVIVYTSGTTGKPKGAMLSHRNLLFSYESVSRSFAGKETLRDGLRCLCNLPPNHIGGLSELVGNTVIRGGTVVFADRFSPADAIDVIEKERITLFGGVPAMLQMIVDDACFRVSALATVRAIGWGGAPAPRALVERLRAAVPHLFTNYGLTEGGAVVCATPPNATIEQLTDSVGIPYDPPNNRIVRDDGSEAAVDEPGEIWLKGCGVFLGYWNNPAATAAALSPDGWLKTGDIAVRRSDGSWALLSRKVEMYKSGGYNIYPREVELVIEQYPGVALAVIVDVHDALYHQVGHAFVLPKPGSSIDTSGLRQFLSTQLANYKLPKAIHIRDRLPMLPIGKVDKAALRLLAGAPPGAMYP